MAMDGTGFILSSVVARVNAPAGRYITQRHVHGLMRGPQRASLREAPCCAIRSPAPQTSSGFAATFSGTGAPLSEQPASEPDAYTQAQYRDLLAQTGVDRPAATHDGSLVVFASGAASCGPAVLTADGCFAVESWLQFERSERLRVRVAYVDGVRSEIRLVWESTGSTMDAGQAPRPFVCDEPLEAMMIAGNWEAPRNERWQSGGRPSSTKLGLNREYGTYNSPSPMLVRLPLGVSVVAPPFFTPGEGSSFSFGTGWLATDSLRPVMMRSYDAVGNVDKVDWRTEKRL
jgi:hypothetical protein